MKKINVAELLRNCPSGMELDCTMYEDVYFDYVDELNIIHCYIQHETHKTSITLNQYGTYNSYIKSKCVIFPKGKTTWEGFVPPCQFKDGDIVYISDYKYSYISIFNSITDNKVCAYCTLQKDNTISLYKWICNVTDCNIRLATEEEKAELFQAIKDNGYRWNPETKTLEKLPKFKVGDKITNGKASITISYIDNEYYCEIGRDFATKLPIKNQDEWELISEKFPNRFNINTLVPFESRVLVRNDKSQYWIPAFWGCKRADGYTTTFGWCKYCIPYEGNEYLLETNNDCNDFYKTWK